MSGLYYFQHRVEQLIPTDMFFHFYCFHKYGKEMKFEIRCKSQNVLLQLFERVGNMKLNFNNKYRKLSSC